MRKSVALLLAAAFVAALPSMASAKKKHHNRHVAAQTAPQGNSSFVYEALHQIFVPLEVTLGGRRAN